MNDKPWNPPTLETDEDFILLKQPLSDKAYSDLKYSLLSEGCKERILVWHGVIVDGIKRYQICTRYNLHFTLQHAQFQSKADAYIFICKQELKRNDLLREMQKYLIGRLYQAELDAKAQAYMLLSSRRNESSNPYIPNRIYRKQDVSQQIADELGIARGTVLKYEIFTKCIDSIREKEPSISCKILSGRLKISHENIIELERLPARDLAALNNTLSNSRIDHITYSDFRHELIWKSMPPSPAAPTIQTHQHEDSNLPIRQMPVYDPDSDLASLIYTIPAWTSSIRRSQRNTDFSKATQTAKKKVGEQLSLLEAAILEMKELLKERHCHE